MFVENHLNTLESEGNLSPLIMLSSAVAEKHFIYVFIVGSNFSVVMQFCSTDYGRIVIAHRGITNLAFSKFNCVAPSSLEMSY